MTRRFIPWLFLAAAVFAVAASLTAKHINWLWLGYHVSRLLIAVSYVLPAHHRFH